MNKGYRCLANKISYYDHILNVLMLNYSTNVDKCGDRRHFSKSFCVKAGIFYDVVNVVE